MADADITADSRARPGLHSDPFSARQQGHCVA
jgi:hypothetical protein